MDSTRWQQINEIFQKAVEAPLPERGALLDRECGDNAELRAEVEVLLTHDKSAGWDTPLQYNARER